MARPDNTIDYLDQGSFMGLRALGRGPVIQFVWIYDDAVDLDGLRRLQQNLGRGGLLARRIERSPLPFGRHRWVHADSPQELDVSTAERNHAEIDAWADERVNLPVDPEHGPPWHLGVQPLQDGGAAVSLVVSHTVGDALAISEAVNDAVQNTPRDLGYPPPRARTRRAALRTDLRQSIAAIPSLFTAVAGGARVARQQRSELAASARSVSAPVTSVDGHRAALPTVTIYVDPSVWDQRAESLGGSSNTLFAALAARVGTELGRIDDDHRAMLSFPVSVRTNGDTRGNALATITVMADPKLVTTDLRTLRSDIKRELAGVDEWFRVMTAPLALTPLIPKFAMRRMEKAVLKVGKPIGCSNAGKQPTAVNRPDGTDADRFSIRMIEPGITSATVERMGGHLFMVCSRTTRFVSVTLTAWTPGEVDNRARLTESVRRAVADLDLPTH
jgi:diacylglycerol O-acyltransferase